MTPVAEYAWPFPMPSDHRRIDALYSSGERGLGSSCDRSAKYLRSSPAPSRFAEPALTAASRRGGAGRKRPSPAPLPKTLVFLRRTTDTGSPTRLSTPRQARHAFPRLKGRVEDPALRSIRSCLPLPLIVPAVFTPPNGCPPMPPAASSGWRSTRTSRLSTLRRPARQFAYADNAGSRRCVCPALGAIGGFGPGGNHRGGFLRRAGSGRLSCDQGARPEHPGRCGRDGRR